VVKRTNRAGPKRAPAPTVDAYLAALPEDTRKALERLRRFIKAAAPKATEVISYQIPAYRQDGLLVGFAAAANHCTFHLMSTGVMRSHAALLEGYAVGKGSIRFGAETPLPAALVRKLVRARIAENRARVVR
jgi:uncharacterized protein YdhG (YjbR/CyaY superfamily)